MSTELDRVLREERRTGRWLAGEVGTNESHVSRWRAGRHLPEQATREKIADALGRTAEELFGEPDRKAA